MITYFTGSADNTSSGGWIEFTKEVPAGTNNVRLTILTYNNQDLSGLDDFKVEADRSVAPVCDLVIGTKSAGCDAVTEGTDTYTARIAYTGGATDTYVVTASSGTVSAGDPTSVAEDTIVVTGVEEGTELTVTITGTVCDETIIISSPNCVPAVALPVEDVFDYTVGESLVTQSNNWSTTGSSDDVMVSAGNLSYSGLKASAGNSVSFEGEGNEGILNFVPVTSGTVYSSFIFKIADIKQNEFTKGGYFAVLGDYDVRLFIWPDTVDASKFEIGIGVMGITKPESALYTTEKFSENAEIFIVMCFDLSTNKAEVWINPAAPDLEAAVAPASTLNMIGQAVVNIGMFIIRQDSPTETPSIVMDEVRVGTSWAEVTPKGVVSTGQVEPGNSTIYPNPVNNGYFMFRSAGDEASVVNIFDITGKKVYSQTHQPGDIVNVSNLDAGIYLLKLDGEKSISVDKFIIE